ncbi:TOMM precursor leader peptide-binding protein [Nonomuraea sp. NPDC047897]|uniref:TOMM precursor leader peptide-binding protein n=1 Tax=Nonomuraea sp. NPDC047897 TaxID=3364346 RepID=UPI0037156F31
MTALVAAPVAGMLDRLRRLLGADTVVTTVPAELPVGRPGVLLDLSWDADLAALPAPAGPVLTVHGLRGRLALGPLIEPGARGCPHCLALRVRAAERPTGAARGDVPARLSERPHGQWWPLGAPGLLAAVIRAELDLLSAGERPLSRDAAYVVDTGGLAGDWHPAIPHALCTSAHCAGTSVPIPPPLPVLDQPLPATAVGSTRRFDVAHFAGQLADEYLDSWSGVVRAPALAGNAALPSVQVDVPTAWGFAEIAIGRADDYSAARTGAVLEGLERYAGWHCGGREPARMAAFAELGDAVDPRTLLLHEEGAYDTPGFEYTRFDPDTQTGWAEAYSVNSGRRTLLPFHIAYYGSTQRTDTGPAFVYENSNGCALGAGVEEALLAALLEIAERDAFLCAWYSGTPLPEIDLTELPARPAAAIRMLRHHTGREVRAFRAVGQFGVPVVIMVSTSDDPAEPATLATAGCALTVHGALLGAAQEMAAAAPAIAFDYRDRRVALEAALDQPELVRHMTDHAVVGALPGARGRFSFLLDQKAEHGPSADLHVPRGDVAADLAAMLQAGADDGRDVIVVDHTTVELYRLGLRCVKAVVPGTAPMTFGHSHRRLPTTELVRDFRLRNGIDLGTRSTLEVRHEPHPFP